MKLQRLRIFGEFAIQIEKKRKKDDILLYLMGILLTGDESF